MTTHDVNCFMRALLLTVTEYSDLQSKVRSLAKDSWG